MENIELYKRLSKVSNDLFNAELDANVYQDEYYKSIEKSWLKIRKKNSEAEFIDAKLNTSFKFYTDAIFRLIRNKDPLSRHFWSTYNRHLAQVKLNNGSDKNKLLKVKDVINIIQTLDRHGNQENLKNFTNFIKSNNLLDWNDDLLGSDFLSTRYYLGETEYIDDSFQELRNILLKSVIFIYGISNSRIFNDKEVISYEDLILLNKLNLIKKIPKTKKEYKKAVLNFMSDVADESDSWAEGVANGSILPMKYETLLPLLDTIKHKHFVEEFCFIDSNTLPGLSPDGALLGLKQIYDALDYLCKHIEARWNFYYQLIYSRGKNNESSPLPLDDLCLLANLNNSKTIRNEFFKKGNILEYSSKDKSAITYESALKWLQDPKRRKSVFMHVEEVYKGSITLEDLKKFQQ